MKKKVMLILSCLFLSIGFIVAQTTRVAGTVVDEQGEPVIGASVVVKGTTIGTTTDAEGKFSLNLTSNQKTLVFSLVGMKAKEYQATPNMSVVMEEDTRALEEVMVVAYGTAKKSSFTGSADVIKPEQIKKRIIANVTKAIDGLATGVLTTSGSGQPGSNATIRIRGYGSINASQDPLYVLDGTPYHGSIAAINPTDIESMTILKDASAGALYGARGANGVIIITTKSGQSGKTSVSLRANWGWASRAVPRYDTVDERGYLEAVFQSYKNKQISNGVSLNQAGIEAIKAMSSGATVMLGKNEEYNPFNFPVSELIDPITGKVRSDATLRYREDWLDEATADSPLRQEYVVDVTGGSGTSTYMFSLGYLNEEGILKTTSFERYSGRLRVDTKPAEWLKIDMGANFALNSSNTSNTSTSASSNVFYSAQLMAPIFPVHILDANGNIQYGPDGKILFDYGQNRPAGAQPKFNSIATLFEDKYSSMSDNLSARANIVVGDLKDGPLEGLALTLSLGGDLQNGNVSTYYNPYFGNSAAVNGLVSKDDNRILSFTFNQLLTWNRKFNDHTIEALVGHEFFSYRYNFLSATKTGLPFGGLYELGAATTITDAGSYQNDYKIQSVLSRFNYNYDSRYYLSLSLRKDGSSVFQKDNRWGTFWSVGGNWRVSEEEFLPKYSWLDNLSLKASYGLQGNDYMVNSAGSRDYFGWQAFYNLGYPNANASGALLSQLENQKLSWEKNHNSNFGLETRIFNRASASIEYYIRKTTDLLLFYPMPTSTGFDGYNRNIGSMRNQGFDISLSGDVFKTKDFDWNLTLMGSTVKNKILELVDGRDIINSYTIRRVGEDIYSFYTSRSAGVDPATGDPLYHAWDLDENGNKTNLRITSNISEATNSKEITGSRTPDLYGSINNQFRYKDFDLSILCTYSIGGKIYDGVYQNLMTSSYVGQTRHTNIERAWKQPGDITDIPKVDFTRTPLITDDALINASYFAIRNITLGYSIPSKTLNKVGIKLARLNITGDNLLLLTQLKGMDPQYNFSGSTTYTYTPSRTISVGVDLKF